MSHTKSWWVIWLIRVMLSSLVSMLPCSMVRCAEGGEGKTALIDQRAVAAGKKIVISRQLVVPSMPLQLTLQMENFFKISASSTSSCKKQLDFRIWALQRTLHRPPGQQEGHSHDRESNCFLALWPYLCLYLATLGLTPLFCQNMGKWALYHKSNHTLLCKNMSFSIKQGGKTT